MRIKNFSEFYTFYLNEHRHPVCRALHVFGTTVALIWLFDTLFTARWTLMPFSLVIGYGFAWIGHFVFEKNRPAAFKQPIFSLYGDFKMAFEVWTFQRKIKE